MRTRLQSVSNHINSLEFSIARAKAVLEKFPDAKIHDHLLFFSSKTVNQEYNGFDFFRKNHDGLYVAPYHKLDFLYEGSLHTVKIQSAPRLNKLVYLTWERTNDKRIMKFSRLAVNIKINNFKEEMVSSCRKEILSYINDNPDFYLNTKHLDPKLKKLLLFI